MAHAASIGMSTQKGEGRANGKMIETWNQWDHLFARTDRDVGVHRIRISPYDRERRVWVIDESGHRSTFSRTTERTC
jgi:hypothetical protein